ncbi:TPA: glycosyltransferase family 4 protein [Photobacterium damselae subsp. damselae]
MKKDIDLYYIHLFNDYSGSPRVLKDAIDCNVNDPNHTYIFTSNHPGFLDDDNHRRVNIFYARSNNRFIQLIYFFFAQFHLFFKLLGFFCISRLKNREIILIVNTMLPFSALVAGWIMKGRVVCYIHETFIKPDVFKRFLRFFIEFFSTNVVYVSNYLRDNEPFSRPEKLVIYNGLRTDFPTVPTFNKQKKFNEKKVLFAGSLKEYKGIRQLLKLAEVNKHITFTAALNCEYSDLVDFVSKVDVPTNLSLLVRPINLEELFSESFLVLNLSLPNAWVETFGLSIIEGMAFGNPVVAPPIGGPTEFVNTSNGALIDSRHIEEITKFICYLSSSYMLWSSYSDNALKTSMDFSAIQFKSQFTTFYNSSLLRYC